LLFGLFELCFLRRQPFDFRILFFELALPGEIEKSQHQGA